MHKNPPLTPISSWKCLFLIQEIICLQVGVFAFGSCANSPFHFIPLLVFIPASMQSFYPKWIALYRLFVESYHTAFVFILFMKVWGLCASGWIWLCPQHCCRRLWCSESEGERVTLGNSSFWQAIELASLEPWWQKPYFFSLIAKEGTVLQAQIQSHCAATLPILYHPCPFSRG